MTKLHGGPFYELSFLVRNGADKEYLVRKLLYDLSIKRNFKILHSEEALSEKIKFFVEGDVTDHITIRSFDMGGQIEISGERILRLFIAELSSELLKINFWFNGSQYDAKEWNQPGLKENDKPEFRIFFEEAKKILNPVLGTIAYEEDCSELFDSGYCWPNECYQLKNLTLKKIRERLHRNINEYEYCWINGRDFLLDENIEIEILY